MHGTSEYHRFQVNKLEPSIGNQHACLVSTANFSKLAELGSVRLGLRTLTDFRAMVVSNFKTVLPALESMERLSRASGYIAP